ncbi:MAG: hypothetical protein ACLQM8_19070 [Limisphaerales bacterium]
MTCLQRLLVLKDSSRHEGLAGSQRLRAERIHLKRFLRQRARRLCAWTGFTAGKVLPGRLRLSSNLTCLTPQDRHCFFGYYDKSPWSESGAFVAYLRTPFGDRMPATGERAEIRLLDCACGEARTIRTTAAWNWQQGCMLQWLPGRSEETLIFNDRRDREWGSVVCARDGTIMREYRAPIYCINSDGTRALSLSFARLNSAAPGYGYPGGDETASDPCPANDGIWRLDLRSGATDLLISISDLCRSHFHPTFDGSGRYILTDTYPNWRQQRTLILYDTQNSRRRELGAFDSPPFLDGPLRCDLHPRFDRQYRRVCVDSAHEGVRRLYTVDLLGIISNA